MLYVFRNKVSQSILKQRSPRSLSISVHQLEHPCLDIPFAKAKGGDFVQDSPHLENSFEGDAFLQRNLQRVLPHEVSSWNLTICYDHHVFDN